jgi:cutinase
VRALAAAALAGVAIIGPLSPAGADGCNDIEVVFARGTGKRPASAASGRPWSIRCAARWATLHRHLRRELPGDLRLPGRRRRANDASTFIQNVVNNCPDTRLVLGGYSQGRDHRRDHLGAVPGGRVHQPAAGQCAGPRRGAGRVRQPDGQGRASVDVQPAVRARAIDLCNAGDPVCSGGDSVPAHRDYGPSGLTNQAAAFVAGLL